MSHSLDAYLLLACAMFAIGTFGFLARRNAIAMLMSVEIMLNAVNLAIVAFGMFTPALAGAGQVIALFVMAVAAAEATVGSPSSSPSIGTPDAPGRRVLDDAGVCRAGIFQAEDAQGAIEHVTQAGSTEQLLITLLLVLPMAGFVITAIIGRRLSRSWVIAVPLIVVVWLIAMSLAYQALIEGAYGEQGITFELYRWIPAGAFQIGFGLLLDNLTAVMLLVVTTVGMLVHVYSIGYMAHDPNRYRFFAYLNLFMFSMLLLVLAANYLLVFAAWELVGLSSYLLIGFWYGKRAPALASKKAFLVNRVGDVGFALGIFAIWTTVGTLTFSEVFTLLPAQLAAGEIAPWMMIGICLLLFCGAVGKSAQFPLHVWLPDAMEGPTPVSALIHAATMVNAGVYLIARSSPLFAHAPEALILVAAVGIFTAIFAASIAFTQKDIKRVLAYSTLSQLGYMFAALGVGAWTAAIFHLVAHGVFKGLLFLGSGSVIHGVQGEQDMDKMGALRRKMPITHWTRLIGSLAIAGIPTAAGFFSRTRSWARPSSSASCGSGSSVSWSRS